MPEMTKAQVQQRVAAMKRELAGYEQDGRKERAAAVRKELAKWDEGDDKPKGRAAAKKSTAARDSDGD